MPQMAPMPWIVLMFWTIIILLCITTIIFFSFKASHNKMVKMHPNKFFIKW